MRERPLAVVRPLSPVLRSAVGPEAPGGPSAARAGVALGLASLLTLVAVGSAQGGPGPASIVDVLAKWTPLLLRGFGLNILISVVAIALGTLLGAGIGIGQISPLWPIRSAAKAFTQFFRNAPWLVLLFYCMLLLPFQMRIGGLLIVLPDWLKASFGLALAVAANMSEILRGAAQSIPTGQWESARSLAFSRRQILWRIVLPQCLKRMLPPWMNLYAILIVSTPLCSIVGVNEVMTLTADALNAESRHDLLIPMYLYILVWFFIYCYPIARWTTALERRFAVKL